MSGRGSRLATKSLVSVMGGVAALFLALALQGPAAAQDLRFDLVDTKPDDPQNWGGTWTRSETGLKLDLNGNYHAEFSWSAPPSSIDASGADITLNVAASITCGPLYAGTGAGSNGFTFKDSVHMTELSLQSDGPAPCPTKTGSNATTVHVIPPLYATEGQEATLKIGANFGPGVTYVYRAVNAGTPLPPTTPGGKTPPKKNGVLKAEIECPGTIVIGQLPGLACNILISGYSRDTAAPVSVGSPTIIDTYGNTTSGIQLTLLEGAEDTFNWDGVHRWPFDPFACKKNSPGVGANCYDNFAVPGPVSIPIVVTQEGVGSVTVTLALNVVGDGSDTSATSGIEFRIGNRLRDGTFLNIETGTLQSTQVLLDWLSARWSIEVISGSSPETVRIRSIWKPDLYLNVEQGPLVAGPIQSSWLSAQWILEGPTPDQFGSYFYRIRNAWQTSLMLDVDGSGNVIVAADQPGSPSQDFWLLY